MLLGPHLPRRNVGRAGYWSWLRGALVVVAVAQRGCPVSSLLGDESLIAAVEGRIVGSVVLPAAPDHLEPGPGQDADGVGVAMAAGSGLLVDVSCPRVVVAGVTGKVHDRSAELLVAGKAEHDLLVLADRRVDGAAPARQVSDSASGNRARQSPISASSAEARTRPDRGRAVKMAASAWMPSRSTISPRARRSGPGPCPGPRAGPKCFLGVVAWPGC
jgi:hypothetical protein